MRRAFNVFVFSLALSGASASNADDTGDVAAGERLYRQCKSCHQVGAGAVHRIGPHLNGIFGRVAGTHEGFRYSNGLQTVGAEGLEWHADTPDAFIENPRGLVTGTRMSFR